MIVTGSEAIVGVGALLAGVMYLTFGRKRRTYEPGPENGWTNDNFHAASNGFPSQDMHDDWSDTAPPDYSGGCGGGVGY